MSGKLCECGQVLSNVEYPNDLEWTIYNKNEFEYWINNEYYELSEEKEIFDYFWLCPKCRRCHAWLNTDRKHGEFRLYEYRKAVENEKIDMGNSREIYVISARDEDSFDENIKIREIMNLYLHDHRYFATDDEKIIYLYNVKTKLLDGKYIIKYSDNSEYNQRIENNTLYIVKTYKGIEKYFDDNGNEIDNINGKT